MFLKTSALKEVVTSGSTATGNVVDISGYSKLWVESYVSGNIAGTGSLFITSMANADVEPAGSENTPDFGLQTALITISQDGSTPSYTTSSILPIDAKWGIYQWTETSGSAVGTGSVSVKWSLLQ